jgi:uncharacterized MAPEG superfamily protein
MSRLTARLQRALNNHFEALILFTLAVVVVTLSGLLVGIHSAFQAGLARGATHVWVGSAIFGARDYGAKS